MDRDEAERALREALVGVPEVERRTLEQALEILARELPEELSEQTVRGMIPEEIGRLTVERTKVQERIDAAMARGALPSPHDYGQLSLHHQQLARWRGLRDDVERGVDPCKAMRKARRLAFDTVIRSNPHIGTPFAQAAAKAAQQAAAAFLGATDGSVFDD
jgi:hypothetical protein